jgi:hypothetical protein
MKKWISVSLAFMLALLVLFTGLPGIPVPHAMAATLYESYDNSTGADSITSSSQWLAQTFTATSNHTVSQIQLYLERESTLSTGTFTVAIKATDINGYPAGPDLTSRTVAVSTLPTTSGWASFSLAPYILKQSNVYAIVVRASSASTGNEVWWHSDEDEYYLGGKGVESTNSGLIWQNGFTDYMFGVLGDYVASVPAASTGYRSPAADYSFGDDWISPWNAYEDDSSSAVAQKNVIHFYYNYNFSIPDGSTINGIEVRLDAWYYQATNGKFRVALSWNGGSSTTSYADSASFSDLEATYFIGGPTSIPWTRTGSWIPSEFSNANFRVKILATTTTPVGLTPQYCRLDWLPVTVYYTPPPPQIGDVNEDGYINVTDISQIVNIILLRNGATPGADVNQDGSINVFDITAVARKILGLD